MRQIKFRGKRVDNGEWVYGHYAELHKSDHCSKEPKWDVVPAIFNDTPGERGQYNGGSFWADVDPDTVGEFTGLRGKNGKYEIFEGDICLLHHDYAVVQYDPETAGFFIKTTKQKPKPLNTLDFGLGMLIPIGTIHDKEFVGLDKEVWHVSELKKILINK